MARKRLTDFLKRKDSSKCSIANLVLHRLPILFFKTFGLE